jgi:epsilon-lactone hydrolase
MKLLPIFSALRLLFKMDHTNIKSSRDVMDRASGLIPKLLIQDVSFDKLSIGGRKAEWVLPPKSGHGVMLYLHGGGYVTGSIRTHRALVSRIAKEGNFKALIIDYRLAPEHPFPAALEDALDAYRYLLSQKFRSKDIVIAGDSAGGGLTMALLLKIRDLNMDMPAAGGLICPWVDLTNSGASGKFNRGKDPIINNAQGDFWADAYAGSSDKKNPFVSPLFAQLHGLPPIYIQAAGKDLLLSDSTRLRDQLKEVGSAVSLDVYEDMFHVWQAFWLFLADAKDANEKMGRWLAAKLV